MVFASVGLWGVALFSVISGYACYGENNEVMAEKILKRIRKNAVITVIAVFANIVFSFFFMERIGQADLWIRGFTNPVSYVRMLLLGDFEFFYAGPLWYLVALIKSYFLFYFLVRFDLKKVIYILMPVTVVMRLVLDTYVRSCGASWHLSANFPIGVLPMMLVGYVIADRRKELEKLSLPLLISASSVSALAMFTASCVRIANVDLSQFFIIPCAAFVFMTGIRKPEWCKCRPVCFLGKEDSLGIYLLHVMVILILRNILNRMQISPDILFWLLPILSVIFSVLAARLLSLILMPSKNFFAKS